MTKDSRLYGKFTLDFPDSHKIMPLSDAAFRCLVEATLWSRKHLTDGLLPNRYALARWGREVLDELSTNDAANPSLIEREDGWFIHDFAEHQTTKNEIESRAEAGRKGGLAKAAGRKASSSKTVANASKSYSKTLPETETETETNSTPNGVELTGELFAKSKDSKPSAPPPATKPKSGTRLDETWRPDPHVRDELAKQFPDVDHFLEFQKFQDYWMSKTGKDATKREWNRTYRNWIRNAAEWGAKRSGGQNRPADGYLRGAEVARAMAQDELSTPPEGKDTREGGPTPQIFDGEFEVLG